MSYSAKANPSHSIIYHLFCGGKGVERNQKKIFLLVACRVETSYATQAKISHPVAMERPEANATISDLHVTNPFRRGTEATTEQNECRLDSAIAAVFSEVMSDYIPSQEQNAEIAVATSQPNSSRASPDSTNPQDEETPIQRNTWPPLEVTVYSLENWPNSNQGSTCELSIADTPIEQNDIPTTPRADPRTAVVDRNPSGSQEMTNSVGGNPFRSTGESVE